jgi:head-tail adaptor
MRRLLTRKLVLEAQGVAPDGAGGYSGDWAALGTHWAEVVQRSGRLEAGEGAARSRMSYLVRVRAVAPGQPSRPRAGQRFRDGNRVFLIRSVSEARSGESLLECLTDEELLP